MFTHKASAESIKTIAIKNIAEILELSEQPIPWLVDNLLIQGGCSLLAAKPKVGKTTFTRCLALAVARGEPFLGKETRKARVLLLSLEDRLSEVSRHFKNIGTLSEDDILIATESPKSAAALKSIILEKQVGLIIIDTLVLGLKGIYDLNDYLQVTQAVSPYVTVARETNAHIILCHHMSKKERGGGDQILGSTALFGVVDAVLLLDRQKQQRIFSTIQRYGADWTTSRLSINDNGWIKLGDEVSDSTAVKDQILNSLRYATQPMTEKEIESLIFGRTSEKRRGLRELLQLGLICRTGAGSKNSPFLYLSPT